jgi:RNA polymerase sigma-70 factor (ECF subfamily)
LYGSQRLDEQFLEVAVSFSSANPATELFLPRQAEEKDTGSSTHLQLEVLHLFDSLRQPLLRYAISFGLSLHDAEDVLQEVFLALFRHLQQKRSRENLPGWLFRVTHNQALRRRSENHASAKISCTDEENTAAEHRDPAPGPEEQLLFNERQRRLMAEILALPATDQMCLRLRAQGWRYREISEATGISLGSVSNSLARSFARLERMDKR